MTMEETGKNDSANTCENKLGIGQMYWLISSSQTLPKRVDKRKSIVTWKWSNSSALK